MVYGFSFGRATLASPPSGFLAESYGARLGSSAAGRRPALAVVGRATTDGGQHSLKHLSSRKGLCVNDKVGRGTQALGLALQRSAGKVFKRDRLIDDVRARRETLPTNGC